MPESNTVATLLMSSSEGDCLRRARPGEIIGVVKQNAQIYVDIMGDRAPEAGKPRSTPAPTVYRRSPRPLVIPPPKGYK